MILEKGYLYHIYNQGNNRQKIFINSDNYFFFLRKIKDYILPYTDLLAWCLMPNHFHLMVLVKKVEIRNLGYIHPIANNRNNDSDLMNTKSRTFNTSIAIMLRSFTSAINKQENKSGSLFRPHTKAECINCFKGLKPSFIESGISSSSLLEEKQYPQICFDYIHNNPVKAGLVKNPTDWEFSSARDYAGLRNGKLIQKNITEKYVDF